MNLKIIISPDRNKLAYIITDDEDKIWWSYKERRAGVQQTSRALESKPKKEGFPSYMCFWLNNRKIGFGRAEETEGYYLSTTVNATSTVLIDNITITNVSCDINNATNSKYNISDRSPVVISSKGGVTHIETDNLTSNTVDTDSEGTDFGSTQGLYGKNIYESFGLKHDDGDSDIDDPEAFGITPTYLIFGTTSSDAWEDQDVNLFLGGFSSENAEYSDYTDVNKHMDINVTAGDDGYSSDLLLYASRGTGGPNLGDWITAIHGERLNTNTSPLFRLRTSVTNAAMEVRYFTRKGFIRFHEGDINASDTFTRRECPFLAAKIVNIDNVSSGEITVSNVKGLLGTADEQYIIYRQGQAWADVLAVAKKGITLIEQPDGNILRFDSYLAFADSGAELCVDKYLDELYISPYRYWMVMEIYNVSSGLNKILPDFSYTHALLMDNSVVPSATVKGFTFNEFLYSDAPFKPNAWSLMISTNSILETEIDYGFGSMDSDGVGEGYLNSKAVIETGFTTFDISGLVRVEGRRRILDIDANKKITLFITPELQSTSANLKLSTTKAFASPVKPYLTFVYTDESPTVEDFKVQPNEDDPFYAQYTWTCKDDDLWYGFMILDETAIKHQYHSAVAHMPFSEKDIETDGSKTYLYRYNDLYNGAAVAGNVGATTGTGSISNTIEGLSGYALDFTESAVGLMRNIYWDDGDYTDPTSHASFVAHVVVNSTTAKHYIVSKREQFEIYIDSGGKVNAKLYYSSSASVNLQSFSVVPEDGETPINIILTFDVGLAVGNCKLFINGKLEDQSGEKNHRWVYT